MAMAIVSHNVHFRLVEFKRWWLTEVELPPINRQRHTGLLDTKFDYHKRNLLRLREEIMPKKSAKKTEFVWKGYCNIHIPANSENAVMAYIKDEKTVFFEQNQLLIDNYTIKFHIDSKSDSFKCTATCYNPDDPNFGHALSAYADSWYGALAVLLYKHIELAERDWTENIQPDTRSFG